MKQFVNYFCVEALLQLVSSAFFLNNYNKIQKWKEIVANSSMGPRRHRKVLFYPILFYPVTLEGRRDTIDEFATIPFHLVLFSAS